MIHPGMVRIQTVQGLLQAQVIKKHLEVNGIPVILDYESIGPAIGITADGLGQVRILVPKQKAEEARLLIQEDEPSPTDT